MLETKIHLYKKGHKKKTLLVTIPASENISVSLSAVACPVPVPGHDPFLSLTSLTTQPQGSSAHNCLYSVAGPPKPSLSGITESAI